MATTPSLITYKNLRFLITDGPCEANLPSYIEMLKTYNVKKVVRVCSITYSSQLMKDHDIKVIDLIYPDGHIPSLNIIKNWLTLINDSFKDSNETIAVHCIAGLGRAPTLVAIALIENGMDPNEVVKLIREKRKGSFNYNQLQYITHYKKYSKKCFIL